MKRALLIACAGPVFSAVAALRLAAAPTPPPPHTGPGDVTAVSVMPAPGKAELVIDVQGAVRISDFVLRGPSPRVVIDLVGARLVAPTIMYDGVERAGIRNVRYSQFSADVVRVVVDLTQARQYQIHQDSAGVHVAFAAGEPFAVWSSDGARRQAAPLPLAIRPTPPSPAADTGSRAAPPMASTEPAPREADAAAPRQAQQPRISVTFDRASIQAVIANFAAFSGRSIVAGKDIAGTVTAEIKDQPWDVAFDAVLAGQGLAAIELPGGIIRVDSRQNLVTQDSLEGLSTAIVKVNYARAMSLVPSVQGIVSHRGRAVADTTTNSIIVTDVASRVGTVDSFIRALDERTPQVAIQAKIIHVQRTNIEALGLQYDLGGATQGFNTLITRPADTTKNAPFIAGGSNTGAVQLGGNSVAAIANASQAIAGPALSLVYSTVIGNYALSTFLSALQSLQLSDVQAEPQVTVADNRPANIWVGQRTPYRQIDVSSVSTAGGTPARATTGFEETGIRLRVTPHIVRGTREVVLELHAEDSQLQASGFPDTPFQVNTQTGETQLLVKDGETAVIAGLTSTTLTVSKSGIPFLVDLPLLGRLFSFTNTREDREDLIILVTPHIIDDLAGNETNP